MHDHLLRNKVTAVNEKKISIVGDNIPSTVTCHLSLIMCLDDVVLKMQSKTSEVGLIRILTTIQTFQNFFNCQKNGWRIAGQHFQQTV